MEYEVLASNLPTDEFLRAYLECAEWCGICDEDEEAAMQRTMRDVRWTRRALKTAREDCADFQSANAHKLQASGLTDARAGHDFWLSRNGHGAGFFDEGCPFERELQDAARVYGEESVTYNRRTARLSFL